jgi:hypothetical protein
VGRQVVEFAHMRRAYGAAHRPGLS